MKIASQIRTMSLGLVLTTAICISLVIYWGFHTLVESQQREGLESVVALESERLKTAFTEVQHDIKFLAEAPSISNIIHPSHTGPTSSEHEAKKNLTVLFEKMLKNKPHYDQIRLIGTANQGKEIVRVDRRSDKVVRVAELDLQQKGSRDYVIEALKKPPGQVYFSKINLNREHGTLETPYRPTLRVAVPLYPTPNTPFGIMIINLNFRTFIDELFHTESGRYRYFLTNSNGGYLVHPDASQTFGFEFGQSNLAQKDMPDLTPLFDASGQEWVTSWKDRSFANPILIHFRKVRLFPDEPQRFLGFGVSASYGDVQANSNAIILKVLAITLLLQLAGLALTFSLTTRLTKPLEWLTKSTNRFAKGLTIPSRPTVPNNEIGVLSLAFDHMVTSIHDKENQVTFVNRRLLQANTDLEHFVHIASHDLREPARQMMVLADLICYEGKEGISPKCHDLLTHIKTASIHLLDQITDFRVFANISQGALLRTKTDMEKLIRSVTEELASTFQTRAVSISLAPIPSLNVYENLVRVLYKKLLDHILKQTHFHDFTIAFTVEDSVDTWILGIRILGTAIDQEQLEKIFDTLNPHSSLFSGSEIDLTICKRIIDRHSGKIWVAIQDDDVHIRFTFGKEAHHHEHHASIQWSNHHG